MGVFEFAVMAASIFAAVGTVKVLGKVVWAVSVVALSCLAVLFALDLAFAVLWAGVIGAGMLGWILVKGI